MIKEAVPLFVKITDKFCDRCKSNGLKMITNGNKSKPVYIGYKCQKCGEFYNIDWTQPEHPIPARLPYDIMMRYNGIFKNYL